MNHKELEALLGDVGWTHSRAAEEIDMTPRQFRRYKSGKKAIPPVVEYALYWVLLQAKKHPDDCRCMDCRRARKSK